jgi:beta-galactosidase
VAPDLYLIPKERAEHLLEYVKNGGHLVLGPRSGLKDEFNSLIPLREPGYLAEALGGRVEQYYALEKDVPASGTWGAGEVTVWAEQMKTTATDAEVLLRYGKSNGWLDGQPCAITRRVGKGRITYVGGVLDAKLMTAAAEWMTKTSGVSAALGAVPDGIEVSRRVGKDSSVFVLINFKSESQDVKLPRGMKSLLEKKEVTHVVLPQYGVAILEDQGKR